MIEDIVARAALIGGELTRIITMCAGKDGGGQLFFPDGILYPDGDSFDNKTWKLESVTVRGEPIYRLEGAGAHG